MCEYNSISKAIRNLDTVEGVQSIITCHFQNDPCALLDVSNLYCETGIIRLNGLLPLRFREIAYGTTWTFPPSSSRLAAPRALPNISNKSHTPVPLAYVKPSFVPRLAGQQTSNR